MSPHAESPLPPSRSRLWQQLLLGVLVFGLAILGLDIPDRIEKGILAQEAIRALDAMRRPLLEIHRLDLGPSRAHPEQYRLALEALEGRMEAYHRTGAFDPSLARQIREFETGLRKWLALREEASSGPAVLPSSMREEKHAFLTVLDLLAKGEAPIHEAIDKGQKAEKLLLLLSVLLAAYAVILFQLFERRWSRVLAAREQDLEATLNSIGDAVIATDTEGRVTRMNPVAERLTGWTLADARGRPLEEVFHIVNAETGAEVESPVAKVLREGQVVGLANHTQLISRKGDRFQIADSGAPVFGHDGSIRGVILVFRDVTGEYSLRREVEEQARRLSTMIQSALDAVIIADEEGRILEWNPSAEAIFGWSSEDIQGRYLHETIIPPDLRQAHLDGLARMREGQPGRILGKRIETRGLRSNGTEFPLELT
ncbi:MAG TPA: PAS domain S-box protein, partial [Thiotrichales bacterium]|nr:PAS domain S-box protein [Thiotrichales bacterium]